MCLFTRSVVSPTLVPTTLLSFFVFKVRASLCVTSAAGARYRSATGLGVSVRVRVRVRVRAGRARYRSATGLGGKGAVWGGGLLVVLCFECMISVPSMGQCIHTCV